MQSIDAYRRSFRSNPDAFIDGARSFCKMAASVGDSDEDSLWSRIKPWLFAIGGLYLGDAWGRHAAMSGNRMGPVLGGLSGLIGLMQTRPGSTGQTSSSGNGGQGQ